VDNSTKKDMMGEEFVTPCKWTKNQILRIKTTFDSRRLIANLYFLFLALLLVAAVLGFVGVYLRKFDSSLYYHNHLVLYPI
jgi:hypothetical protein